MATHHNKQKENTQNIRQVAWSADKLNRESEGVWLCDYLTSKFAINTASHNKNFVLNINADWGFGKTYFLNNIKLELENRNHQVVYFDAWKNDFSDKPLLGFISEINSALESFMSEDSSLTDSVKDGFITRFKKLKEGAAPLMLGFLAKQLVGSSYGQLQEYFDNEDNTEAEQEESNNKGKNKTLDDVAKTVSSITTKTAELALKEHITTKDSIDKFKVNLKYLVDYLNKEADKKLPLFILVDELDRCRPNYAIELLETIKHLFEVEGVYFIVATASHQLSHSINAIYGEKFESKRYLNRFFDQEYKLAIPKQYNFCEYLWKKHIPDDSKFIPAIWDNYYKQQDPKSNLNVVLFNVIAEYTNAGLRDIEQAIKLLNAVNITSENRLYSSLIFFLILCKIRHPIFYTLVRKNWNNLSFDGEQFTSIIENDFNKEVTVKYLKYEGRKSIVNKIGILSIVTDILSLNAKSLPELLNANIGKNSIKGLLISQFSTQNNDTWSQHNPPLLNLSNYTNIVDQVGQLL